MKIVIHGRQSITLTSDKPVSAEKLFKENKISLSMPCGGNHTCGKCRIRVKGAVSKKTEQEEKLLLNEKDDVRLACLTTITGDCEIYLPSDSTQIISDGYVSEFLLEPEGINFGFAVDIGTTTVAVYLYNLKTGALVGRDAFSNPQSIFGADVISRIQASVNGSDRELQSLIGNKISESFSLLCEKHGIEKSLIDSAVITGNTAMLYLLLRKSTACLAAAPFEITDYLGRSVKGEDCGIDLFPCLSIYLPRTMSSFVGSDITCSVLAASDLMKSQSATLLTDIGTNGEMVIKKGEKLYCCSTAAGPAFEGAGITMGSMAVPGAVNKVWLEDGEIRYSTIGSLSAEGICGSGLIDAVAVFLKCGLIDESGCINDCAESPYICEYKEQSALKIGESGTLITQSDIRSLQLAKSAIRAGIESLSDACGITADSIDSFILAGGFGSYINPQSAAAVGLIPKQLAKFSMPVGNAAGMGAASILLSKTAREKSLIIAETAETVELSTSTVFMDSYIENMLF